MPERMDQYNSGKMLTHPFPNLAFSPRVSVNIRLGGRGKGSFPKS